MQMDDEKITFENILVTPLERWIDADVDLDPAAKQMYCILPDMA